MRRTLTPQTPRPARLPRFLRRRQPVPLRVLAALCAALSAPVTAPALLATGATALLAASAAGPAWAGTNQQAPIPGIGIVIKKNPGSGSHKDIQTTTTDRDGRYSFSGLEPGRYELLIDSQRPSFVEVGKDGRLSGVVTRPVKVITPRDAVTAPEMSKDLDVEAGRTRFIADAQAASGKPMGAAKVIPPADEARGRHEGAPQPQAAPLQRHSVQVLALADGYFVKFAGQPQGFRLNTVNDRIDAVAGGAAPRLAAEEPPAAPARLQAFLKDETTGRIVPLTPRAEGFVLPGGLEDGRYRYALKVMGGGLGDRPCPPGCSEPGFLAVSIDRGQAKGTGDPKAAGF